MTASRTLVVDASVALRWLVEEADSDAALALRDHQVGRARALADLA